MNVRLKNILEITIEWKSYQTKKQMIAAMLNFLNIFLL